MASAWHIGKLEIASRVLVAPMSGITDLTFRRVLARFAPGYVVSEMVAGKEFAEGDAHAEFRAAGSGEFDPFVIQLVGRDPKHMAAGARRAEELGADIVDLNMGCPARKVTSGLCGSALMRDLNHAAAIIDATVRGTSLPVTLKMRLGWDHESLNAPELARMAEDLGVQQITVHGRTRCQFYEGTADWRAVQPVVEATSLPVCVNGDVASGADARQALEKSGASAVMVGRSLVGRPWLLADIRRGLGEPVAHTPYNPAEVAVAHYRDLLDHHGARKGVKHGRKHIIGYLEHAGAPGDLRDRLVRCPDPEEVVAGLREAFALRLAA